MPFGCGIYAWGQEHLPEVFLESQFSANVIKV